MMKLLVQSDDYGFTKGTTLGILEAIDHGIVRNTGLFVNMGESSEWAVKEILKRPQACLGIDFNIVSGPCVSDPQRIPHLVDEKGYFIRSTEKYKDPQFGKKELWPYTEVMIEIRNQFRKFTELTGKNPEYLHTHSISPVSPAYIRAISDLSKETGIPFSAEVVSQLSIQRLKGKYNVKPFSLEAQSKTDVTEYYKNHLCELDLAGTAMLGCHCGYADAEIFRWSTYTMIRCRDLEAFTSDFMKDWVKNNQIQLITYRDLQSELQAAVRP